MFGTKKRSLKKERIGRWNTNRKKGRVLQGKKETGKEGRKKGGKGGRRRETP